MVLANGSQSSQSDSEGKIRKNTINGILWTALLLCCLSSFTQRRFRCCPGFFAKNKKQKGKTPFIDARKMGTMVTRKLLELTDDDIKKIANTYNVYVEGTLDDKKGFWAVVTI